MKLKKYHLIAILIISSNHIFAKEEINSSLADEIKKIHFQIKNNESQINTLVEETAKLKTELVHLKAKHSTEKNKKKPKKFTSKKI